MDPQQRIALEEGYAALHSARLNRGSLMNSTTGVFGGIWQSDYAAVLPRRGAASRGGFAISASGCCMLVGRLSPGGLELAGIIARHREERRWY